MRTLLLFISIILSMKTSFSQHNKLHHRETIYLWPTAVPFIIHWPNKISGNQRFDGLTSSLDIFTTSLAAAKIEPAINLDGVDLLPYVTSEKKGNPHNKLFWRKLNEAGVRMGSNKLVYLNNFGSTLYDLQSDLGETTDLTSRNPKLSKQLNNELKEWEKTLMKPLWDEGNWMDVTRHIQQQLMENEPILYKSPGARKKYLDQNEK